MKEFENVFIFVSDSFRWDHLPDSMKSKGITFKTVASSCYSAPSFSSLATGRYPQRHGVAQWDDSIPDNVPTIFDIESFDGGFHQENADVKNEALYSILNRNEDKGINQVDAPFIILERDLQPHAPFSGTSASSVEEYYSERKGDWDIIRKEYSNSCNDSVERFSKRLSELENMGLLDSTLCVFTSDHGELLGEYGEAGHSTPATPELVYVPTVFMNPNLDESEFNIDNNNNIIEHVDIIETFVSALDINDFETDGVDLLNDARESDWGYNNVNIVRGGRQIYAADSIWWYDGGYVSHENSLINRCAAMAYRILSGPERKAVRRNSYKLTQVYLPKTLEFGTPRMNKKQAISELRKFKQGINTISPDKNELDSDTKDRLEDLGYLD